MDDTVRDFMFELKVTGCYFKDLVSQRTSKCCSMHFHYNKGIINPKTNRWTVIRVCEQCGNFE
jgi:hypothetical protein